MIVNIHTQSRELPTSIGSRFNITWQNSQDLLCQLGWRELPDSIPQPPQGFVRVSEPIACDYDGTRGIWICADRTQIDIDNEIQQRQQLEYQQKLESLPMQDASAFKTLLRLYFGENAELDHNITSDIVETYFSTLETITTTQLKHAFMLDRLHRKLCAWNNSDETWSIFEQFGASIP